VRTIWKSALSIADEQTLMLPAGAQFIAAQMQYGFVPTLWVLVDPASPLEPRTVTMYGTGHEVPENPGQHLGTVQQHDGALVWHIFERGAAD
jgi:hypothetical protein